MSYAAVELVDVEGLRSLERAAEGLPAAGIASALIQAELDPGRGLAGVPRAKVNLVEGCLIASFRPDVRPTVAGLVPRLGNSTLQEKAFALSEARSQGHRAFEAAQAAYNEALNAEAAG